jgi:hypothetical protein
MFRFLLLKVPHVQFFVIIKVMLDSILIVYEKKYVQVFVIKSTPRSIFCYYKSYVAFSFDCVYEKKHVQLFVIKSIPCSVFVIIKAMLYSILIV